MALLLPSSWTNRSTRIGLRPVTADFALIVLSWLLVGAVRARLWPHAVGAPTPSSLLGVALLHAAMTTLLGQCSGLYAAGSSLPQRGRMLGKAVFWATALLWVSCKLQGAPTSLSMGVCGAGVLDFAGLFVWRWEDLRRERRAAGNGRAMRNVLIVGAGAVGRRVASHVRTHPEEGRAVCGILDDDLPLGDGVIGRVSNLARLARTGFVDEVMLAAPHDREQTLRVLHEARRLRLDVEMVPDLFGCRPAGLEAGCLGDLPLICLHEERSPTAGLLVKRGLDVLGASLALAALAPLLAVIAIVIKLDSRGRVLYTAQRAGRKGRLFQCHKFRTMVSNADGLKTSLRAQNQRSGPFFKLAEDPRITRVGRFLRRYSLDELPQLWNVVRGEMSLVGPRPHPLDDVAAYEVEHLARLDVTPGITGLWQVTARRDPSFQRSIELDREYIGSWSLGLDAQILLKTVAAVARGSGD
jgi:exopolysaccharide biosynthesis polyprenyl glycosylphosphotransferase